MYAIRALIEPNRIEITLDGTVDDAELAQCVAGAATLAEAGSIGIAMADIRLAQFEGLEWDLAVALLATKGSWTFGSPSLQIASPSRSFGAF